MATSQMYNLPSRNFPKVRLGLLRHRRLQWDRVCGKERFGKFPLGKRPLGKYLTS